MSCSDNNEAGGEQQLPSLRVCAVLVLTVVGLSLVAVLIVAGGAMVGKAIEGTVAGVVGGGFAGLALCVFAIQRFYFGDNWIECGCLIVIVCVLGVVGYFVAQRRAETYRDKPTSHNQLRITSQSDVTRTSVLSGEVKSQG